MMDLDSDWYAYQCNSGEVLFYYNTVSGEHKWAVHFCSCLKPKTPDSQPEPCCTWEPVKAKSSSSGKFVRSIGTETEDRYFSGGLDSHQTAASRDMRAEISFGCSEDKTNDNGGADGSIYSGTEEPVEVVLSDPFLPDKHSVTSKRLTLKLTDMSKHDISISNCYDSTPTNSIVIDTMASQKSINKSVHIQSTSNPDVKAKQKMFASFKRGLPSFCTDNDIEINFSKKKSKASTSSRKNPEPRKLAKRIGGDVIETGEDDEEGEHSNGGFWQQELQDQQYSDSEEVQPPSPVVKVEPENPSSSMYSEEEDLQDNAEEPISTVCELCGQDCGIPSHLTNHLMKHQPSGTRCPICNKLFSRRQGLRYHVQTHSGDKPHVCTLCNKTFTKSASLVAHIRTHSGIKPFKCPKCNKGFTHSSNLSSHLRIHSSLRPYRCRFCNKGFKTSSHLSLHLRCHSDERPYRCLDCGKAFKNSSHLKSHKKLHLTDKNVICGNCNEGFKSFSHLMYHQQTNHQCHGVLQRETHSEEKNTVLFDN